MPLNYDFSKVADKDNICLRDIHPDEIAAGYGKEGDKMLSHLTKAIIFLTMSVDMGEITEQNYEEFFFRVRTEETLFGTRLRKNGDEPYFITKADIRDHIGLRVNVITKTRRQWLAHQMKNWERNVKASD